MFIDEKSQIEINANLDETVIHATMRNCDLIPAFLEVIKNTPEYVQIIQSNDSDMKVIFDPCADDSDERWDTENMNDFLNETLFDTLQSYAPENYYFGAHIGDGSDFAYWKCEDDI